MFFLRGVSGSIGLGSRPDGVTNNNCLRPTNGSISGSGEDDSPRALENSNSVNTGMNTFILHACMDAEPLPAYIRYVRITDEILETVFIMDQQNVMIDRRNDETRHTWATVRVIRLETYHI